MPFLSCSASLPCREGGSRGNWGALEGLAGVIDDVDGDDVVDDDGALTPRATAERGALPGIPIVRAWRAREGDACIVFQRFRSEQRGKKEGRKIGRRKNVFFVVVLLFLIMTDFFFLPFSIRSFSLSITQKKQKKLVRSTLQNPRFRGSLSLSLPSHDTTIPL